MTLTARHHLVFKRYAGLALGLDNDLSAQDGTGVSPSIRFQEEPGLDAREQLGEPCRIAILRKKYTPSAYECSPTPHCCAL